MYQLLFLFLLFIIYSFIGWCIEVIGCSITSRKIVNRGFLIGPYCPIYGIGCLLISILCTPYIDDMFVLFILVIFLTSTLEYFTSYILEKMFNARWWDYSNSFLNIDGRVCIINSIGFGLGGVLFLNIIEPITVEFVKNIPLDIFYVIASPLFIFFIIDIITSFKLTFSLKNSFTALRKDYTSEISSKIRKKLIDQSKSFKRILQAFPNAKLIGNGKKHRFFKRNR